MLIGGALVFDYVATIEHVALSVQRFVATFQLVPIGYLLLVNAILLVLGCLLEGTTILLVIVPILIPTAKGTRHRSRPLRSRSGRQYHDWPTHASIWAVALRRRKHDQETPDVDCP